MRRNGWTRVAALAAMTIVVAACSRPQPAPPSAGKAKDMVRVQRAGFSQLAPSVADPLSLVSRPVSAPVRYAGQPVVQACGLLTPADLRAGGFQLRASSQPGAVTRDFFDGESSERIEVPEFLVPSGRNDCSYGLQDQEPAASAVVQVYQSAYANADAMRQELKGARPVTGTPAAKGFVVDGRGGNPARSTYVIGYKGVLIHLEVQAASKERKRALARKVASRLVTLTDQPQGPPRFGYDSPTFAGDYANGCELAGAGSFKAVFGSDPSPLAEERAASSVAVGTIERGDSNEFNYVQSQCVRESVEQIGSLSGARTLTVSVMTFERPQPAQAWFDSTRTQGTAGVVAVDRVGDEAFYADRRLDGRNASLSFRKGRVLVTIEFKDHGRINGTAQRRLQVLTPVARAMVDRLADF